jgi:hypothetical protein
MLQTSSIPQYDYATYGRPPEDWNRFLQKACKGSIKAPDDILTGAEFAYMVALTGDQTAPETMNEDDYREIFRRAFPTGPRFKCLQEFHDTVLRANWIPNAFTTSMVARQSESHYCGIWGREPVKWTDLVNDAMLLCLESWSADHCLKCEDESMNSPYDSRKVVATMLYLCLTWPGT